MKIKWWHAVAVAGVVWLGRMLWSTAYTQGFRDGLGNHDAMLLYGELLNEKAGIKTTAINDPRDI